MHMHQKMLNNTLEEMSRKANMVIKIFLTTTYSDFINTFFLNKLDRNRA